MCGIAGIITLNKNKEEIELKTLKAVQKLNKRGPDFQSIWSQENVCFGHARLSIIDTTENSHQPFVSDCGNYIIVFNGEIYNYKTLRESLKEKGYKFRTSGDTEVLLNLYIEYGEKCLDKLNGFFAFAVINISKNHVFITRDRFGIKPLNYHIDKENKNFIFGSELKAIYEYDIEKEIDNSSLLTYLHLNYIPAPKTILKNTFKLLPGHYIDIKIENNQINHNTTKYYNYEISENQNFTFDNAKKQLKDLVYSSVEMRLVADVPVGTFLSGGIDSSIITSVASELKPDIDAFTIGFKDEPYFDETKFASMVAKKSNISHHIIDVSNKDLLNILENVLEYTDEPFADSSALAVYLLCEATRKKVTVALSGDGADEIFTGYRKHIALKRASENNFANNFAKNLSPILKQLPQSRNNKLTDVFRKAAKYSDGLNLNYKERYWKWAGFYEEKEILSLLKNIGNKDETDFKKLKNSILEGVNNKTFNLNDVLATDVSLVLANDMLVKTDWMSMANSLELRVPFLDYRIVEFAFSLPNNFKLNNYITKHILRETFRNDLPKELFELPKKGFEVPLLKWFRNELKTLIFNDLLSSDFIKKQNIFEPLFIEKLKVELMSNNPADSVAKVWALIVFQNWWKKHFD
jgi:asparagine synthase (glutamine-hydrolysing)